MGALDEPVAGDPLLSSCRHKLERGDEHIRRLAGSMHAWLTSGGYRFVRESSADGLQHAVFLRVDSLPVEWSLLLGDAVQNLRNALDHLVNALTVRTLGRRLTRDESTRTWFPVEGRKPLTRAHLHRTLAHVPAPVQALVMSLQPSAVGGHTRSTLWLLHEMSNRDKHRTLTTALTTMTGIAVLDPMTRTDLLVMPGTVVKDGDELCRYTTNSPPAGPLRASADLEVTFGPDEPLPGRRVVPALCQLRDFVDAVTTEAIRLAAQDVSR